MAPGREASLKRCAQVRHPVTAFAAALDGARADFGLGSVERPAAVRLKGRVVERNETPPSLFRRFQFDCYRDTRAFLERLSVLSKETGLYPDLGFGTTHVNVTLYGANGGVPGASEVDFASRAAALALPG